MSDSTVDRIPPPLTVQQVIDALVQARGPDAADGDTGRAAFLAGYDAALDGARRLADYPWHLRPATDETGHGRG